MQDALFQPKQDGVQELRRAAGNWLRNQREAVGFSQTDLARALNLEYYTFISQIENGRGRIPANRYVDWADALQIPRREFAMRMMQYYDPVTYELIFGDVDAA